MRAVIFLLILLSTATQAGAQTDRAQIEKVESRVQKFFNAQLAGDAEANLTLCADNVVFMMGGLVRSSSKEALVELSKQSPAKWNVVDIIHGPVTTLDPNGHVAYVELLVRGVADLTLPDGTTGIYDQIDAYIQVWSKSGDDWLLSAVAVDRSTDPKYR